MLPEPNFSWRGSYYSSRVVSSFLVGICALPKSSNMFIRRKEKAIERVRSPALGNSGIKP